MITFQVGIVRMIIWFKTSWLYGWSVIFISDHPNVRNLRQIEKIQEKAFSELGEYCARVHPEQPDRQAKLLLRLPALRLLSPTVMEELFFAGLIGNVQIDSIIPYILRMETGEYSPQLVGVQMTMPEEQECMETATVTVATSSVAGTPEMNNAIIISPPM